MSRPNNTSSDFVHAVPTVAGGEEEFVLEEMQTASAWYTLHKVGRNGRWFVRKGLNDETRGKAMFEGILRREYELLADIDHQNVVRVYRWIEGKDGEGSAFEMQYVDGRTLREFIAEDPSRERKIKVVRQLLDALEYIHSKQITHQDITPSNVLVSWNGDRVKLIDFGLAHDEAAQLKLPAGTEDYIAPEVLEGGTADSLSDLYSLGRVLLDINISPRVNRLVEKRVVTDRNQRILDVATLRQAFFKALKPDYKIILAVAFAFVCCTALCLFLFLSRKKSTNKNDRELVYSKKVVESVVPTEKDTLFIKENTIDGEVKGMKTEPVTLKGPVALKDVGEVSLPSHERETTNNNPTLAINQSKETVKEEKQIEKTAEKETKKKPILDGNGRYLRSRDKDGIYTPVTIIPCSFKDWYNSQAVKPFTYDFGRIELDLEITPEGKVGPVRIEDKGKANNEVLKYVMYEYVWKELKFIPAQDSDGNCVTYHISYTIKCPL